MKGWIYILSNDSVPHWLAIGCSETDPEALLRQYGNSGIKLPYPFELQYALRTPYPKSLLQKIHNELSDDCINPDHNQDWFECDLLRGIRIVRHIAGNSATGEAFFNKARQLTEQAQSDETEYVVAANSALITDHHTEISEIRQIRTVPEIQRGKRPSPIAPQVRSAPSPTPLPEPKPEPPPPEKEEPKWLISLLIVVLVCLLIIAVFLLFYLYGYI